MLERSHSGKVTKREKKRSYRGSLLPREESSSIQSRVPQLPGASSLHSSPGPLPEPLSPPGSGRRPLVYTLHAALISPA